METVIDQQVSGDIPLTEQEIFDKVWNHFVVKKKPLSFVKNGDRSVQCLYRKNKTTKCAVGIFIPDEEYNAHPIEQDGVTEILKEYPRTAKILSLVSGDFLSLLQGCHDDACDKTNSDYQTVRRSLTKFANKYKLTMPKPI